MLNYEFISDDELNDLPEDPTEKFIKLEGFCRKRVSELINDDSNNEFDAFIRQQYMAIVAAAAEECLVEGLELPKFTPDKTTYAIFETFIMNVTLVTTRLRLRNSSSSKAYSVQLSQRSKALINREIERLRVAIEESELPLDKRNALLAKLKELSDELHFTRLNFAKAMAIIAYVSCGVGGTTSFLANAPEAIATITKLIGADKQAEDNERRRLIAPPERRALPAPDDKPVRTVALDEEMPF